MSTPKVATLKRQDSRFYLHPDDARKVPGVTSVVGMLPKPFLVGWAAKETAEFAVRNLGAVKSLVDNGVQDAAVNMLKDARWATTRGSARLGDAAHEAFERMAHGEDGALVLSESEDPDALEPFVRYFGEFLDEYQPEFLFMEETVWSDAHLYAGSFDALAVIQGERVWIDNKTTRSGVHTEVALQLSAYANADFILRGDGSKVPLPKAEAGACLLVRPYGWSFQPVRIDEAVFDVFLKLRAVFDWDKELQSSVLGKPLNAKPITTPAGRLTASADRAEKAFRASS